MDDFANRLLRYASAVRDAAKGNVTIEVVPQGVVPQGAVPALRLEGVAPTNLWSRNIEWRFPIKDLPTPIDRVIVSFTGAGLSFTSHVVGPADGDVLRIFLSPDTELDW